MTRRFRAPGRVNLIGDHTDYQDGLVLPVAMQLCAEIACTFRGDRVRVTSAGWDVACDVPADGSAGPSGGQSGWARYPAGVVWALSRKGRPAAGLEGEVSSTVPAGGGLSSSAALEVAVATALIAAAEWDLPPMEVARACQQAEIDGAGVPCGIMDQAVAVLGSVPGALFLDCRSLHWEHVPLPDAVRVVVIESGVPRALAASGYAERRRETDHATRVLGLPALRDATLPAVDGLPHPLRLRAHHVVTENQRVLDMVEALHAGDALGAGHLLNDSHRSLSRHFASSHPRVDALVAQLQETPGVFGARITGGGFGGTVVALAEPGAAASLGGTVVEPSPGAAEVPA